MSASDAADEDLAESPREPLHEHRDVTGGWLRPAVFGAMDGLVSNFALIAGVVGGGADSSTVALAGLAGLAAGAFSMAAGEYTSVASQSELALAEIELERRELHEHPEVELEELARMYARRGVDLELAREFARQVSRDPQQALEAHVWEELGVHPDELPSPAAGGRLLVRLLRARGAPAPAALPVRGHEHRPRAGRRPAGAVRGRGHGLPGHRAVLVVQRVPPDAPRRVRGGAHLRLRDAGRRRAGLMGLC